MGTIGQFTFQTMYGFVYFQDTSKKGTLGNKEKMETMLD